MSSAVEVAGGTETVARQLISFVPALYGVAVWRVWCRGCVLHLCLCGVNTIFVTYMQCYVDMFVFANPLCILKICSESGVIWTCIWLCCSSSNCLYLKIFKCLYMCVVWADADTWFERQQQEEEIQRLAAEHLATVAAAEEADRKKLQETRDGETEDDPMAQAEAEVLSTNPTQ